MSRSLQAPGFEFHEIDRSLFDTTIDQSLPNAPVCFLAGYANDGLDYIPQYINTKNALDSIYGYPTNDEERYLYNGINEVLEKRGICIAAKLPYNNEAKNKFSYVDYNISSVSLLADLNMHAITEAVDSSLKTGLMIQYDNSVWKSTSDSITHRISETDYYDLASGIKKLDNDIIRIVDISHLRYSNADFNCVSSQICSTYTNDCLGIVPIIVAPTNAMCFQDLIPDNKLYEKDTGNVVVTAYNNISELKLCKLSAAESRISVDFTKLDDNSLYSLSSDYKYITTVSRTTSQLFPKFSWKTTKTSRQLNNKYNKCICVVVLKMYVDTANSSKINYTILENFFGTLDKNNVTKDTPYIEDAVNGNSLYIMLFANIKQELLNTADIVGIQNQAAQSLGFYNIETSKKITASSTMSDLQKVFERISNTREFPIDLVVDAGISNIALKYASKIDDPDKYRYFDEKTNTWNWKLEKVEDTLNWNSTIHMLDTFCKHTRGDCMLIADCLKTMSIEGNAKIVDYYKQNTIKDSILPKLSYLPSFNSSYAAGYCNWLKMYDAYSSILFWMPPSIKALGSYIYCSTYRHTWAAPAGTLNSAIANVLDISFNPNVVDAESLYINNWNYFVTYPLYGTVIEGLKTFLSEATSLDRINVRRLLLYVERKVVEIGRKYLYQTHTAKVRQRFVDDITVLLESVKNGSGLSEYSILCDSTNNTQLTIDNNELHAKIAIKPIKTIEYIIVSFALTNLSLDVLEEVYK